MILKGFILNKKERMETIDEIAFSIGNSKDYYIVSSMTTGEYKHFYLFNCIRFLSLKINNK